MATFDASEWEVVPTSGKGVRVLPASDWEPESPAPINDMGEAAAPVSTMPQEESILASAGKDILGGVGGMAGMVNQGVMDWVNILNPSEKNTLYRFGKIVKDEFDKGTLGESAWQSVKGLISPVFEDIGKVAGQVKEGEFAEAAETIARQPFTYAMDIASLSPLARATGSMAKAGSSIVFGPKMESISARISNSAAIRNAKPPESIALELPDAFKTIDGKIKAASENALKTLSDDPKKGYPVKEIKDIISETKKRAVGDVISASDEQAINSLNKIEKNITKVYKDGNIPQKKVKEMIQKLDKDINWDVPLSDVTNKALQDLRRSVDIVLKADNPAYDAAMRPLARLIGVKTAAQEALKIDRVGGRYVVDNSVVKAVGGIHKGPMKVETIRALDDFGIETGLNVNQEISNFMIKQDFAQPNIRGARRAAMGGFVGGAVGGVEGAGVGSAIGGAVDIVGGKILGGAIDATAPVLKGISKTAESVPEVSIVAPAIRQELDQ